ncbi:MAG: S8 family serine peptidase, partial [Actinomycetes bacterium]
RTTDTSDQTQAALRGHGAQIVHVSPTYSTITANIPVSAIHSITSEPFVVSAAPVLLPATSTTSAATASAVRSPAPCDVLDSEANDQLRAALARSSQSVDGTGITVGVLSDSFNVATTPSTLAQDVAAGALPGVGNACGYTTPVNVVSEYSSSGGSDEGRAMLQLVHSVAPAAHLVFATAFQSQTSFADNIIALKDAGATVIVDDVTYFDEPVFQDGPVAAAVTTVTNAGVTYLSSAGNNNLVLAGKDIASWEAPAFRSMACPAMSPAPAGSGTCMNFNPNGGSDDGAGYTVAAGKRIIVDMQWSEPMYGVSTDMDLYLIDSSTHAILKSAELGIGDRPQEILSWTNGASSRSIELVIRRYSGANTPRVKLMILQNGANPFTSVEYNQSSGGDVVGPVIFGHNGGKDTISVAAIPYYSTTTPETFSSHGPVTLYWNAVDGTTPASALAIPEILARPDITATDGDCTTAFFGLVSPPNPSCPYRFYGTSAAAPNAAGVVALMRQKNPSTSPASVRATLKSTASALSGGSVYSSGSGLVDAVAAVGAIADSVPGPPTDVNATPANGSVSVSWTAPSTDGGHPIIDYTATALPGGNTCTATAPTTHCTITGLTSGTLYTFTVTATNTAGPSAPSAPATATPFTIPNAPTALAATAANNSADLTWTA